MTGSPMTGPPVRRRPMGPNGPEVSQLCYGTMRMPAQIDGRAAADYLCRLHDAGIDTLHSSHEYDSDAVFTTALRAAVATGRVFHHIVKLAEPSFDHDRFDPARLQAAVDRRLADLDTDHLACVQWMIRTPEPENDSRTLPVLTRDNTAIMDCVDRLVAGGKIGSMALFPYTPATAEAAITAGVAANLAVYLNRVENRYTDLLDRCQTVIAIRPLAGGALVPQNETGTGQCSDGATEALRYPLLHPAVATTIVSVNSSAHLDAAVNAAGGVTADRAEFNRQWAALNGDR